MMKRIFVCLLCLLLALPARAETADWADAILQYEAGASSPEGWMQAELPQSVGVGGEWYALALHQRGYELPECLAALEDYLSAHAVRSATSRLKFELVRLALGGEVSPAWHADIGQQGVMSWAWGLHLLNNGCTAPIPVTEVVEALLDLQLADGGWAVSGAVSDADVTAMVVQALAPHRQSADVKAAIDQAVTCLSHMQLDTGDYASYGVPCPESTAQVLTALCALNIDGLTDARFIKSGATLLDGMARYRLEDGSFSHTLGGASNRTATMQVFLAMTAYQRYQDGQSALYLLDAAHPAEMHASLGYKPVAAAVIAGLGLAACLVMWLMGKRHPKNWLAVLLLAGIALAFVLLTDFQSAEDYYSVTAVKKDVAGSVTVSIRCDTVAGRAAHIPADGVILPETSFPIAQGDTALTILNEAARAHGILMEVGGGYVSGISNVFEFDFGDLSGWLFFVNGQEASVGSDQVKLADGDVIEWRYTLQMGRDME